MPMPANVTTVTVLGTFLTPEGNPSTGTVSFTPSSWLTNSGANIAVPNSTVTKTLGTAGDFTVNLPITDDPDLTPANFVYSVSEVVDGVSQSYNISIPGTIATGGTLYLADLAPVAPAGPEYYSLASSLAIGTVTTVATGGSATATITGLAPSQVLNLGIPTGATGTVASAGSGSVGTAAVAPTGDPNTGIYFPAADQVAVTTGGTQALLLAAGAVSNPTFTGVATFAAGTVSAPAITTTGDTNTGLFFPAADTVAVSTGGTERLRVNSSGQVGIGVSPNRTLALSSSTAFQPQIGITNTNTDGNGSFIVMGKLPTDNSLSVADSLGQINFQGADTGGTARNAAFVNVSVSSQGSTFVEGYLGITTTNSSGTTAEKFRLDGNGLITGTGTSLGAWTTYTPTLGGTGWALGNGTVTAAYCRIGKTVLYRIAIVFGSTSTFGAAALTVSLPFTAVTAANHFQHGIAQFVDTSLSVTCHGIARISSGGANVSPRYVANSTYGQTTGVVDTGPFTWANTDELQMTGSYEIA